MKSIEKISKRDFLKQSLALSAGMFCFPGHIGMAIEPDTQPAVYKRLAMYQEETARGIMCRICPNECVLKEGELSKCNNRKVYKSKLYTLAYGNPCSVNVDSVEKKPLYHFLPGESTSFEVTLNGEPAGYSLQNGYAFIQNNWKNGDKVVLHLPMTVKKIKANEKVEADLGKIALQRGPLVYCLESVDNPGVDLFTARIDAAGLQPQHASDLFDGISVIKGRTLAGQPLTFIPYQLWANRGPSQMNVWIQI